MCESLEIADERCSRIPAPLVVFTVVAGVAAMISLLVAWRNPGEVGVGLVMTAALIAAVPAVFCARIAFWPRLREPLIVLFNHALAGCLLAYFINPEVRFALTVACVAGVAGCASWILICTSGSLKTNLNWLISGLAAGGRAHPRRVPK